MHIHEYIHMTCICKYVNIYRYMYIYIYTHIKSP